MYHASEFDDRATQVMIRAVRPEPAPRPSLVLRSGAIGQTEAEKAAALQTEQAVSSALREARQRRVAPWLVVAALAHLGYLLAGGATC
jgi:PAB1-binding protein PBP1